MKAVRSRRSLRARLTLTYGALFLLGGVVLIAITYLLMKNATGYGVLLGFHQDGTGSAPLPDPTDLAKNLRPPPSHSRQSDLDQLLIQSSIALAITTLVALAAGWFVAGRALRPLRAMTTTARQISQHNLHERLTVAGPHDEVKDLADTIDALLARLETAFDAQSRFVANASHELRTPLTWDRALIEVTLADPDATMDTYRSAYQELLASNEDKERLIEALLTLASSERGLRRHESLDLAQIVRQSVDRHAAAAHDQRLKMQVDLAPAPVEGDRDLLKRLIDNLLDNAIGHNVDNGSIEISTRVAEGRAVLVITSTGPILSGSDTEVMQEPFQRLELARSSSRPGYGIGLSIVRAVAVAHGGDLALAPRAGGGLDATVVLPRSRR